MLLCQEFGLVVWLYQQECPCFVANIPILVNPLMMKLYQMQVQTGDHTFNR